MFSDEIILTKVQKPEQTNSSEKSIQHVTSHDDSVSEVSVFGDSQLIF